MNRKAAAFSLTGTLTLIVWLVAIGWSTTQPTPKEFLLILCTPFAIALTFFTAVGLYSWGRSLFD